MTELESLRRIRSFYGAFLDAAADLYRHRPEVLAGIMQRETAGGTSRLMKDVDGVPDGNPADDVGDHGFGLGLMQIDRRAWPKFYQSGEWKNPQRNIEFGAYVLAQKRAYLANKTLGMGLTDDDLERASVAAYNCGEGNVMKAIRERGWNFDAFTTGRNYSADVLRLAEIYRGLA